MKPIIILLLLGLAAMWLRSKWSHADPRQAAGVKPKTKPQKKNKSSADVHRHPYHAVSIYHETDACPSVLSLGNKRFLSAEAPGIPLDECNLTHCKCKYIHHTDRRCFGGDRRSISQGRSPGQEDRRRILGRRQEDREDYGLI